MNEQMTFSPTSVGQQTFDGLGRQLSVTVGGRPTQYHYQPHQLPPSANTLADGQRIDFSYVRDLDNRLKQIRPDGEPANDFSYDKLLALTASACGPLGMQTLTYTASGQPETATWAVDGTSHSTTWRHSLGGVLLGFEDAANVTHQRQFDTFGRLKQTTVGAVTCSISYDDFSRPHTFTTVDNDSGNQLLQTLAYDRLGREHSRTFTVTHAGVVRTQVQTLTYTLLDQVETRHWQDDTRAGTERFTYDQLGRLLTYTAEPAVAPQDPFGNRVVSQVFTLNVLDGYDSVLSTFVDGTSDTASYTYNNPKDRCQVSSIAHTHPTWPATLSLRYDDRGRLQEDSLGRKLSWDAQDRLTRVEYQGQVCTYGYDPSGNLCDRTLGSTLTRSFHSAGLLTHEQRGSEVLHLIGDAGQLFALDRLSAGVRSAILLGCDAQGSVRIEADNTLRSRHYTAHGAQADSADQTSSPFAFAGQRREPLTHWYIPGGNRPYDPLLMIFLAPDSESPFGRGGINPYAYCAGDPVNRVDPDGHAWWKWLVAGIGAVLGAVAVIASFGTAAPGFAALAAALAGDFAEMATVTASTYSAMVTSTLSAVSIGTGVASDVLNAMGKDQKAAGILGWISLGTGLLASAIEIVPRINSVLTKLGRSTKSMKWPSFSMRGTTWPQSLTPSVSDPPQTIFRSSRNVTEVAYHPNYLGLGMPAFETHGAPLDLSSRLMNSAGVMRPAEEVAGEIEGWLTHYGHPPNKEFILLACNGGSSGAAQKVANTTGRRVWGFSKTILVQEPSAQDQLSRVISSSADTNYPLELRSFKSFLTSHGEFSKFPFLRKARAKFYDPA